MVVKGMIIWQMNVVVKKSEYVLKKNMLICGFKDYLTYACIFGLCCSFVCDSRLYHRAEKSLCSALYS